VIPWNQRVIGKSPENPCSSRFCGQNLENIGLGNYVDAHFFRAQELKILISKSLVYPAPGWGSQNLEPVALTRKILRNKYLAFGAAERKNGHAFWLGP
jgi:hypothetical protein